MSEPGSTTPVDKPVQSVGDLVSKVTDQFSRLIRGEMELAQLRLKQKFGEFGAGGGMLAAAGVLALYAFGILLLAAVWGIAEALPLWLSALIVGVFLLIVVAILAALGKKRLDAAKAVTVDPRAGIMEDVEAAKKGIQQ